MYRAKNIQRIFFLLLSSLILSGCLATNPLEDAAKGFTTALTSTSASDPLRNTPIVMKVPNDSGIQSRKPAGFSTVITRDIGFDSRTQTVHSNAMYHRLLTESLTPNSFVVHARTDNGVAGSGVKYSVNYAIDELTSGYQVRFTPESRSTYQTGLIGRFPIPPFDESDLRKHLTSLQIVYKFEVDSSYNSESVISNFTRLARAKAYARGWADPVTGKIFGRTFVSELRGNEMTYVVEVFPYRSGSKAVITAIIPGVETSAHTVDFSILIREVRAALERIARA